MSPEDTPGKTVEKFGGKVVIAIGSALVGAAAVAGTVGVNVDLLARVEKLSIVGILLAVVYLFDRREKTAQIRLQDTEKRHYEALGALTTILVQLKDGVEEVSKGYESVHRRIDDVLGCKKQNCPAASVIHLKRRNRRR